MFEYIIVQVKLLLKLLVIQIKVRDVKVAM